MIAVASERDPHGIAPPEFWEMFDGIKEAETVAERTVPPVERDHCPECGSRAVAEKTATEASAPGNRKSGRYRCPSCSAHSEYVVGVVKAPTGERTLERVREAYARRNHGEPTDNIAGGLGVSRGAVIQYLQIAAAEELLLAAVDDGYLSIAAVNQLRKAEPARRRHRLAEAAAERGWSAGRIREERESDADTWVVARGEGWLRELYEDVDVDRDGGRE